MSINCLLSTENKDLSPTENNVLLRQLSNETIDNCNKYLPYVEDMSPEKLKNGLSQYVLHSNYNTSFGDLVPVIVANAIHLNVIILMKSGMNFTVHGICIDQSVNSVLVVKSGEHYDATVPSNINLSTIAVNHNRDITLSHNKMNSISQHSRISGNKKVLPDNTIDFQYNTFRIAGLNVCGPRSKLNYGILNNYITTTDIMGLTEVTCNASQITQIDDFNTIFMLAKHRQHQFGGVHGIRTKI